MRTIPEDWRDHEATWAEWDSLPKEKRVAIVQEYGFRRRPDAPPREPAKPSPAATPVLQTPATSASSNATSAAGAEVIAWCRRRREELNVPESYSGFTPGRAAETLEERWQCDASLREEFGEFERFAAYERMEQAGRIRVAGKSRTSPTPPKAASGPTAARLTLEEDVVARWHNDPSLRHEFGELREYAALRQYIAGGASGLRPRGVSQERLRLEQSREEDRLAAADPRLPVDERALQVWQSSEAIRWEFRGNRDSYVAYRRSLERRR